METTDGFLLGRRVRYRQPVQGYRTGNEPVFLAAAIPAVAGERVLEGGTGAGAALLCLAARVAGVRGTGVELDAGMAALARDNLRDNGLTDWPVLEGDVTALAIGAHFDHACANPPWHDAAGTPSSDARRRLALHAPRDGLHGWARALAAALRPGGTATLILPQRLARDGLDALRAAGCGEETLVPLWPKRDRPARTVLVQGRRGSTHPGRQAAGLVVHDDTGAYTAEARAILWDGAPLPV